MRFFFDFFSHLMLLGVAFDVMTSNIRYIDYQLVNPFYFLSSYNPPIFESQIAYLKALGYFYFKYS